MRDSGVGLSAPAIARIFDLFVQEAGSLPSAEGGLGIGLALVKGLTKLHGGRIAVASDGPGQGSTFTVTLPVEDGGP